ncbi:hypothetical protein HEP87_01850 [Streptomyces sp. S1D4-11]|nr:hypothetical protein [Streptomyces sp. S1D4-11]QIY93168.1 hypothetical protein HEP87_01850 [Streptomyces sp. S1D4-11]
MHQKVALSELAATIFGIAAKKAGVANPRNPRGKFKGLTDKDEASYVDFLIDNAAKAGLGINPHAHAFFAHELDYFAGRPRILEFDNEHGASSVD